MTWLDPYSGPWTGAEAAHLARRAAFGGSPSERSNLLALGLNDAVSSLVDYDPSDGAIDTLIANLPNDGGELENFKLPQQLSHLQGRWIYTMVHTPRPAQEQLTLFLHDMITTEWRKVHQDLADRVNQGNDGTLEDQLCGPGDLIGIDDPLEPDDNRASRWAAEALQNQNNLMRLKGGEAYGQLLKDITRDPAMLVYLDNKDNAASGVQENFSREIMELFSMGVGNYSEQDVVELAKVFTGETLDDRCERNFPLFYVWDASIHSTGNKSFLGQTITFSNVPGAETDAAIDVLLDKVTNSGITPFHSTLPAASIFLAYRLLTWYVTEDLAMDHPAVEEFAQILYATSTNGVRYDFREALKVLFQSVIFYDNEFRYNMYKHPVDFIVGALRTLELEENSYSGRVTNYLSQMGMELFNPYDVNGWDHGTKWIYSGSLIGRFNYANQLSRSNFLTNSLIDGLIPGTITSQTDEDGIIDYLAERLIQQDLRVEERVIMNNFFDEVDLATADPTTRYRRKVRGCLHLMMTLPRYQLK